MTNFTHQGNDVHSAMDQKPLALLPAFAGVQSDSLLNSQQLYTSNALTTSAPTPTSSDNSAFDFGAALANTYMPSGDAKPAFGTVPNATPTAQAAPTGFLLGGTPANSAPAFAAFGGTAAAAAASSKPAFSFNGTPAAPTNDQPAVSFSGTPAAPTNFQAFGGTPAVSTNGTPAVSFGFSGGATPAPSFGAMPPAIAGAAMLTFCASSTNASVTSAPAPTFDSCVALASTSTPPGDAKPAFGTVPNATPTAQAAPPGFSFGGTPANSAPAFATFRGTAGAAAASSKPAFSFGGTPAAPTNDQPALSFGGTPAAPTNFQSFGSTPAASTNGTPAVSFGGSGGATPASSFGATPHVFGADFDKENQRKPAGDFTGSVQLRKKRKKSCTEDDEGTFDKKSCY